MWHLIPSPHLQKAPSQPRTSPQTCLSSWGMCLQAKAPSVSGYAPGVCCAWPQLLRSSHQRHGCCERVGFSGGVSVWTGPEDMGLCITFSLVQHSQLNLSQTQTNWRPHTHTHTPLTVSHSHTEPAKVTTRTWNKSNSGSYAEIWSGFVRFTFCSAFKIVLIAAFPSLLRPF